MDAPVRLLKTPEAGINDDIGHDVRLELYRLQVEIREGTVDWVVAGARSEGAGV